MQQRTDSLAQQVEHNTFNVGVLGSSPRRITQKIRELLLSDSLFLCLFYAGLHGSVKPRVKPRMEATVNVTLWGIERSGFFNGREKWAKDFENQRV